MGCVFDGYPPHMRDQDPLRTFLPLEKESTREQIISELKNSSAELMVNYLPVGSEEATRFYASCALEAGLGFVNNIPVFIASDPMWAKRFADRNLPLIGDDIKAQMGATILHRMVVDLFRKRGVKVDRTYQLNTGGNTDFLNMLNRDPTGVQEDIQDRSRAIGDRRAPGGRKYPYRPERLRAVAARQQNCVYPYGRPALWRCADGDRLQTFGRGFAELGRGGDRRDPLLQTGTRSRYRRRFAFRFRLFLEASARANDRRRGLSLRRAIHPRRARSLERGKFQLDWRSSRINRDLGRNLYGRQCS